MSELNLAELAVKMIAAAATSAGSGGAEVEECLKDRFDAIAKYAKAIEDDHKTGNLTKEKYEEHKGEIDRMAESAIRVCKYLGEAIAQEAVKAAMKVFWEIVTGAIGSA